MLCSCAVLHTTRVHHPQVALLDGLQQRPALPARLHGVKVYCEGELALRLLLLLLLLLVVVAWLRQLLVHRWQRCLARHVAPAAAAVVCARGAATAQCQDEHMPAAAAC